MNYDTRNARTPSRSALVRGLSLAPTGQHEPPFRAHFGSRCESELESFSLGCSLEVSVPVCDPSIPLCPIWRASCSLGRYEGRPSREAMWRAWFTVATWPTKCRRSDRQTCTQVDTIASAAPFGFFRPKEETLMLLILASCSCSANLRIQRTPHVSSNARELATGNMPPSIALKVADGQ